jgi:hypothetical protein
MSTTKNKPVQQNQKDQKQQQQKHQQQKTKQGSAKMSKSAGQEHEHPESRMTD